MNSLHVSLEINQFSKQRLTYKSENKSVFKINSLHISLKINQFSKLIAYT